MADKRVEALLDFSAQVLYEILRRHIGFDKAFQLALHSPKAVATKYVPLKMLYRVSRS
ncbi:MAG TPA: RsmB/NOP family class I SAM-dependent RNA methyltransferase, partial [Pyrodictiaceae archaeon]|nr:RsmB/NOP family class I SAM-dependent RNA methyltransferase [Pyrodictiaceae archaeon]